MLIAVYYSPQNILFLPVNTEKAPADVGISDKNKKRKADLLKQKVKHMKRFKEKKFIHFFLNVSFRFLSFSDAKQH